MKAAATPSQVDSELQWLYRNRPRVRFFTRFARKSGAMINAQVGILRDKVSVARMAAACVIVEDPSINDAAMNECCMIAACWLEDARRLSPSDWWTQYMKG